MLKKWISALALSLLSAAVFGGPLMAGMAEGQGTLVAQSMSCMGGSITTYKTCGPCSRGNQTRAQAQCQQATDMSGKGCGSILCETCTCEGNETNPYPPRVPPVAQPAVPSQTQPPSTATPPANRRVPPQPTNRLEPKHSGVGWMRMTEEISCHTLSENPDWCVFRPLTSKTHVLRVGVGSRKRSDEPQTMKVTLRVLTEEARQEVSKCEREIDVAPGKLGNLEFSCAALARSDTNYLIQVTTSPAFLDAGVTVSSWGTIR